MAPYISQYIENPFELNAFAWSKLADIANSDRQREALVELQDRAVVSSVAYVKGLRTPQGIDTLSL